MTEINLQEIRSIQIGILNKLDDFCRENGIGYYLCNGTLLGAVKYKGYIPWDDDIDVCMLRNDYQKFISLFNQKNENEKYKLFSLETDTSYFFPFAKLSDQTTVLKENGVNNGVKFGLNIDVFPIDNFGNSEKEIKKTFIKFKRLRKKLNLSKINDFSSNSDLKYLLKKIISFPFRKIGPKYFCNKIDRLAKKHTFETKYIGNCVWGFYGVGEAHKSEVFSKVIFEEFEGKKYPIPIGFNEYLFGLYGDYRQDPPLEKQCTHHRFKAYYK